MRHLFFNLIFLSDDSSPHHTPIDSASTPPTLQQLSPVTSIDLKYQQQHPQTSSLTSFASPQHQTPSALGSPYAGDLCSYGPIHSSHHHLTSPYSTSPYDKYSRTSPGSMQPPGVYPASRPYSMTQQPTAASPYHQGFYGQVTRATLGGYVHDYAPR